MYLGASGEKAILPVELSERSLSAGDPRERRLASGRRHYSAPDIGSVGAFLASDDACGIIGDTIRIDGGSKL